MNAYLKDLLDQPAALRNTCDGLSTSDDLRRIASDLRGGMYRRVVFTGMGSSYHAQYPLYLRLTQSGLPCLRVETSELIHYMRECLVPDTLVVAVSQSGRSAELIALLEAAGNCGALVTVTNTPESPLAVRSTARLITHAGTESTVSCKTYLSSLLALEWLGTVLAGEEEYPARATLAGAADAVEEYLAGWEQYVDDLRQSLRGVGRVFVTGRGTSLATAGTGGLILKESAHFAAEGMSSAAFRHGPFESLSDKVFVAVSAGDSRCESLNRRLVRDVREAGGRAEIIGVNDTSEAFRIPRVDERIRPVVEILPVQMMSLALAALTGHEAGTFVLATKVTTTE